KAAGLAVVRTMQPALSVRTCRSRRRQEVTPPPGSEHIDQASGAIAIVPADDASSMAQRISLSLPSGVTTTEFDRPSDQV
ncbi:MAG: hypothetical protein Q9177_003423, partial [Variospora cf. flavescens]